MGFSKGTRVGSSAENTDDVAPVEMDDEDSLDPALLDVEELREAFRLFDQDNNGFISAKELGECIERLGETATPDEIEAVIASVNPNGPRDQISFDQFVEVLMGAPTPTQLPEDGAGGDGATVNAVLDDNVTTRYSEHSPEVMDPTEAAQIDAAIQASLRPPRPPDDTSNFKPLNDDEKLLLRKMLGKPEKNHKRTSRSRSKPADNGDEASSNGRSGGLSVETTRKGKGAKDKKASKAKKTPPESKQQQAGRSPQSPAPPLQVAASQSSQSQELSGVTRDIASVQQLCVALQAQLSQLDANQAVANAEHRQNHRTMYLFSLTMCLCNVVLLLLVSGLYLNTNTPEL